MVTLCPFRFGEKSVRGEKQFGTDSRFRVTGRRRCNQLTQASMLLPCTAFKLEPRSRKEYIFDMVVRAPQSIAPAAFRGLRNITWNRDPLRPIPAAEVFALYERNWRHIDPRDLDEAEKELVADLTHRFGGGNLLT